MSHTPATLLVLAAVILAGCASTGHLAAPTVRTAAGTSASTPVDACEHASADIRALAEGLIVVEREAEYAHPRGESLNRTLVPADDLRQQITTLAPGSTAQVRDRLERGVGFLITLSSIVRAAENPSVPFSSARLDIAGGLSGVATQVKRACEVP